MSGSLDRHLFLWDVDAPEKRIQVDHGTDGYVKGKKKFSFFSSQRKSPSEKNKR